jgi:hypothetical protein
MAQELKRCPFCGMLSVNLVMSGDLRYVHCDYCYARGPAVSGNRAEERAADLWNHLRAEGANR